MATTVYHVTDVDSALAATEDGFTDKKHQVPGGETRAGVRVTEELPSAISRVPLEVELEVEHSELVAKYGVGEDALILPADYVNSGSISLARSVGRCEKREHPGPVDLKRFHFKCCWQCRHFSETDNEAVLDFAYGRKPVTKEEIEEIMDWIDEFFIDVIESRGVPMTEEELHTCIESACYNEGEEEQYGIPPGGRRGPKIAHSLMAGDSLLPGQMMVDSWPEELSEGSNCSGQYHHSSLMWRRITQKLRDKNAKLSADEWERLKEIRQMHNG